MGRWVVVQTNIIGITIDLHIILYQNTVMEYCNFCLGIQTAVSLKSGSSINYVVRIPFQRTSHGVDQRSMVLIDAGRLAVPVSAVIV